MSLSTALVVVAEATEEHEKISHWVVGGIALAILLLLMIALVSFGGGRDHS